jgi:hypothetical protein
MKPLFNNLITVLAGIATLLAACSRTPETSGSENRAKEQGEVKTSEQAGAIVSLDEARQQQAGLIVEPVVAAQISPEVKGYGRVLDISPLAALAAELATAKAGREASQAELKRLETLAAQSNASERALQAAAAAAIRDQAQSDAVEQRLVAGWGRALAGRGDLPTMIRSLAALESALVRVDLPAGETLKSPPPRARLVTLADVPVEAEFLGVAPAVDPQTQGQGLLFLVQPNSSMLAPGEAVTAYLPVPGEPLAGLVVPRSALIRHAGAVWVYVVSNGTNFSRRGISPAYPMKNGWFISGGVAAGDRIVVTGAQTVFSEELNSNGFRSGDRD